MKKMNLKFLRLKAKIVLPLFMLFGLFFLSASSLSAQYVGTQEALANLTQANISIIKSMDDLVNAGNAVQIEKAKVKQFYLKSMILELKAGSSVKETVNKFIGQSGLTKRMMDYQLSSKENSQRFNWLKDELLDLLKS